MRARRWRELDRGGAMLLALMAAAGCGSAAQEDHEASQSSAEPIGQSSQALTLGAWGEYIATREYSKVGSSDGNLAAMRTLTPHPHSTTPTMEVLTEGRVRSTQPYSLEHVWVFDGVPANSGDVQVYFRSNAEVDVYAVGQNSRGECGSKWVMIGRASLSHFCGDTANHCTVSPSYRSLNGTLPGPLASAGVCVKVVDTDNVVTPDDPTATTYGIDYVGVATGIPDLIMTEMTAPASASFAEPVPITYSITNRGTAASFFGFHARGFLMSCVNTLTFDSIWSNVCGTDVEILDQAQVYLAPGQKITRTDNTAISVYGMPSTFTCTGRVNIPAPEKVIGFEHYQQWPICGGNLVASGEVNNQITENTDNNNVDVSPPPMQLLYPDRSIESISLAHPSYVAGEAFRVDWVERNLGPGKAVLGHSTKIYLSKDSTLSESTDTLLGTLTNGALGNVGASRNQSLTGFLDGTLPSGQYYIVGKITKLAADWEHDFDLTNNQFVSPITIIRADTPATVPTTTLGSVTSSGSTMLDFSPDGTTLAMSSNTSSFGPPQFVNLADGTRRMPATGWHSGMRYTQGGHFVVSDKQQLLTLSDAATLAPLRTYSTSSSCFYGERVVVSADGSRVFTSSGSGTMAVYDTLTGEKKSTLSGCWSEAALNSNGTRLLVGVTGGARLYDVTTPTATLLRTYTGFTNYVYAVEFSPDGTLVLAAGADMDRAVRVWATDTGALVANLNHGGGVGDAHFTSDGRHIVSFDYSAHSMIFVWDLATSSLVRAFSRAGNEIVVRDIAVSPDSSKVAASYADGLIMLWPTGLSTPLGSAQASVLNLGQPAWLTLQPFTDYSFAVNVESGRGLLMSASGVPDANVAFLAADSAALRLSTDTFTAWSPVGTFETRNVTAPTAAGWYFFNVRSPYLTAGTIGLTVKASYDDFVVAQVEPRTGGNAGDVTVKLRGIGLERDTLVRLVSPTNQVVVARKVRALSPTEVAATFPLAGASPGSYRVEVEHPTTHEVESIASGFTVTTGVAGQFTYQLAGPASVRPQRVYDLTLTWENTGDTDIPAPFLFATSSEPGSLRTADFQAATTLGYIASAAGFPSDVLPPHTTGRVAFTAAFTQSGTTYTVTPLVAYEDANAFNWTALEAVWPAQTLPDLQAARPRIGSTSAQVFHSMRHVAENLQRPTEAGLLMQMTVVSALNGGLDY